MQKENYKRPMSVLVLIATRQGDVLLMERQTPKGFWQSVTGSLNWGELADAAAAREVLEETGLRCADKIQACKYSVTFKIFPQWRKRYEPGISLNREFWYVLMLNNRRSIKLDNNEHRQYRWVSWREAHRRVGSWTNRHLIEHVFMQPRKGCRQIT